jgi:hypothetical protein
VNSDVGELEAHGRIRAVIEDATRRVAAIVEPAVPTTSFLAALAEELGAASADPASTPYPELIDPDAYWEAAVKPQSQSIRRGVTAVLEYAESHIEAHLATAEAELEVWVDRRAEAAAEPGERAEVIDDIATHCQVLHHLVAGLIGAVPARDQLETAHEALDEARRRKAITDVEALKPVYLREAGGDEEHQRFAEQQWSETFSDRVAHRDLMLRGEVPWRHQELAIVGHERTCNQLDTQINETVTRLQQPLLEVGARLVRRYDSVTSPSA